MTLRIWKIKRRRILMPAVLVVLLLSFGSTLPTHAAPPEAGAQFGSVDFQKIESGYTKKGDLDHQIQAFNQKLQTAFHQQMNSAMLTSDQQTELGKLLVKDAPTDADKARITALQAQSTHDAQELATLTQKKDLTDADHARMTALIQEQTAGQQALQDTGTQYADQVKQENDRLNAQLSDTVKAAIVSVASKRGLDVVFDSNVAIYTRNDITDDVLKVLNK